MESIKAAVRAVRAIRKDMNVPVRRKAQVYILTQRPELQETFSETEDIFGLLCGASGLSVVQDEGSIPADSVSSVIEGAVIYIPLSDLVDVEKERARLSAEKDRLLAELKRSASMLSNERFLKGAPEKKVEEEKQKKQKYEDMLRTVEERLAALA